MEPKSQQPKPRRMMPETQTTTPAIMQTYGFNTNPRDAERVKSDHKTSSIIDQLNKTFLVQKRDGENHQKLKITFENRSVRGSQLSKSLGRAHLKGNTTVVPEIAARPYYATRA